MPAEQSLRVDDVVVADLVPVGGGDICSAFRGRTRRGGVVFVKTRSGAPRDFFRAEARGLDRIRVSGGPPVPQVVAVDDGGLVLEWVAPGGPPGRAAAEDLGRALATLHATSPASYGADSGGFIATLPLDNPPAHDWPSFYAEHRLAPYLGALTPEQRRPVQSVCARVGELAGPAEQPALIHGDLWSGNVHWAADGRGWLVDAASAHGGHRETDLAMLALFGARRLDDVLRGYVEALPLAPGWRDRVPLHQLHPLLVHATLFGGGYGDRAAAAATAALTRR